MINNLLMSGGHTDDTNYFSQLHQLCESFTNDPFSSFFQMPFDFEEWIAPWCRAFSAVGLSWRMCRKRSSRYRRTKQLEFRGIFFVDTIDRGLSCSGHILGRSLRRRTRQSGCGSKLRPGLTTFEPSLSGSFGIERRREAPSGRSFHYR